MDNPSFLPEDEKTPSVDDQTTKVLDSTEDEIQQNGSQMTHSPNTQEITAIVHPAPPEITKESEKIDFIKSVESPSKNEQQNGTIHDSGESSSEKAPPITKDGNLTSEHVPQTSNEKPVRSYSLTNGQSVTDETIHKVDATHSEFTATEKQRYGVRLNGTEGTLDENFHSSDSSISIPEAETLASNKRSGWYYVLFAIFFLGFFLALTLGLIFGRENKD